MGLFGIFKKSSTKPSDMPIPQYVDPHALSDAKKQKDLEALSTFEDKINNATNTLSEVDASTKQEDKGLELENPFRGH